MTLPAPPFPGGQRRLGAEIWQFVWERELCTGPETIAFEEGRLNPRVSTFGGRSKLGYKGQSFADPLGAVAGGKCRLGV